VTMPLDRKSIVCGVCCIIALAAGVPANDAIGAEAIVVRGGHQWGVPIIREMAKAFSAARHLPKRAFNIRRWDDKDNIERFARGECKILVHRGYPTPAEKSVLEEAFGNKKSPQVYLVGVARVAVWVHRNNPVSRLTLANLRTLYEWDAAGRRWCDVGGGSGGVVVCYGTKPSTMGFLVVRHASMMRGPDYPTGYRLYREDMTFCQDMDEIAGYVAKDRNGIAFCLYQGQETRKLKPLAIGKTAEGPFIKPAPGVSLQEDYPLTEPLLLYLHPDSPYLAQEFCEFAVGLSGADIAGKHGLTTRCDELRGLGERRLVQSKAGRGVRLSAIGSGTERSAMMDLAREYVRAKEVVQLSYAPAQSDIAAVGAFVTGGAGMRELLLLGDKPSGQALQIHGDKWDALGPDGTGPVEYTLAGRTVAMIVNPANKLESLTPGQLQAIFTGEVDDWAIIGGSGLSTPLGPGGRPTVLGIKLFGLRARDPVTAVFEKECVSANKWKHVTIKKDTAEAVAAVSMDAQAMAFVDLTAIPATGQSVKVLAIQMGIGEKAKIIQPTPENIRNAMYPLSQRLYLYVHPKASDAAKNFAKFVASCGGSEASLYADTIKAGMETYQKHGLIPLADVAIERVAKAAIAEATAKAKGRSK